MNVASNLCRRILQLSDSSYHNDNIKTIKNILLKNNYPIHMINKTICKIKHQLSSNQASNSAPQNVVNSPSSHQEPSARDNTSDSAQQNSPNNNKTFNSLTYVPQVSDKISRIIKNTNSNHNIAFKVPKSVKSDIVTKTKQKIGKFKQCGVIYRADCKTGLCPVTYIGETGRQLETRKREHERDFRNRFTPSPKTALINHSLETGHEFDFDGMQIIDREKNRTKRRIIESSHIFLNSPNSCNFRTDTNNLNSNYTNILNSYKSLSPKFKQNNTSSSSNLNVGTSLSTNQ